MGRTPARTAAPRPAPSAIPDDSIKAMAEILEVFRGLKDEEEREIAAPFEEPIPKKYFPDYYAVITKPMSFKQIETAMKRKTYQTFYDFVQDCAQICHNAKLYNQTGSDIFNYALTLERVLQEELVKLKDAGRIEEKEAVLPDLGPIPDPSDPENSEENSAAEDVDEEQDEEEEEEEEDDDDDEEDEGKRKRRKKYNKQLRTGTGDAASLNPRRKRGRPPRVDTPMEMRIKNVIKGLRRVKDENNNAKIKEFDKLPDPKTEPNYYNLIGNPISVEIIKKRIKRREYKTFDSFMSDLRLLFSNSKQYYHRSSQMHHDADQLEREAQRIATAELAKGDDELREEIFPSQGRNTKEQRIPLKFIDHKGVQYRVGDWIHLVNPNDPSKPTVGQIHRTWQTEDGEKWLNACWFYRPEQTVHSVYRRFFKDEVFKTGQYRDHHIDEVIEKCFVMFVTRYSRGRPKGCGNMKVYVCESRYNEETKQMNKIKTWKSCIPDEIRGTDYEMDLFTRPEPVIRINSPIANMLPANAKEGDPIPDATMGAENAPPVVGAVYKGARDESPPPESPPATPATAYAPRPTRSSLRHASSGNLDEQRQIYQQQVMQNSTPMPDMRKHSHSPAIPLQGTPGLQHAVPMPNYGTPVYQPQQQMPMQYPQQRMYPQQHPQQQYAYQQQMLPQRPGGGQYYTPPNPDGTAFILGAPHNGAIPDSVAAQFQRDADGNLLWWKTPPMDASKPAPKGAALGHSLEYLAHKKEIQERQAKRKAEMEVEKREAVKRAQKEMEGVKLKTEILTGNLLLAWTEKLKEV